MARYWVTEQLGEGANGAIFGGEYGALRRPIAIKILHEHLVGDPSGDRMLAEARTLSMLDHPGIVKVFDSGTVHGRAFIVMERLSGESLSTRLARTRLSEARVVLFARQLASAMETAHGVGIIHRDLKPENVFIVPDPEVPGGERVKIIDFGIAKRDDQESTATGIVLGTPSYMAPEQWRRAADPRADIYSLGVLLYVMATGELPFAGDTNEVLAVHAYCVPPRACELGGVSSWLSSIIERCLAKDPDERYRTMATLGAALHELECAIAPPTGPLPRHRSDDWEVWEVDDDEATIMAPRARGSALRPVAHAPLDEPPIAIKRRPRWPFGLVAVLACLLFVQPRPHLLHAPQRAEAEPARVLKQRWADAAIEPAEEPRRSQRRVRAATTKR